MIPRTIWNLPKIEYQSLFSIEEERPVALITDQASWDRLGSTLNLPIVVQAEPEQTDEEFLNYLSENVPGVVEVVYVVGSGDQLVVGKVVAHNNNLPLVVVPTELDTDQLLEAHAELMNDGIVSTIETGPAEKVIIDWDVILASDPSRRAGVVADMLSIVTGLLDWRYAAKQRRSSPDKPFIPWAAGIAAGLASHTIKISEGIGNGDIEALRTLVDLTSVSVQLANQMGHARQQEGTEHYFAAALEKQGVQATHAEMLAPGLLLTSALHKQDPAAIRDALQKSGIRLDAVRAADIQVALNDLQNFVLANNFPYAIAHEIDPFSDELQEALRFAGLSSDTGGWEVSQEAMQAAATQVQAPAQQQPQQPQQMQAQQPQQPQSQGYVDQSQQYAPTQQQGYVDQAPAQPQQSGFADAPQAQPQSYDATQQQGYVDQTQPQGYVDQSQPGIAPPQTNFGAIGESAQQGDTGSMPVQDDFGSAELDDDFFSQNDDNPPQGDTGSMPAQQQPPDFG